MRFIKEELKFCLKQFTHTEWIKMVIRGINCLHINAEGIILKVHALKLQIETLDTPVDHMFNSGNQL